MIHKVLSAAICKISIIQLRFGEFHSPQDKGAANEVSKSGGRLVVPHKANGSFGAVHETNVHEEL